MLEIAIPGYKTLQLNNLVLDYNGTLACDGQLLPDMAKRLNALSRQMKIHILTADTFGSVNEALADVPVAISVLPADKQDLGKLRYVVQLGADTTVCVGNGRNDRLMLEAAALGIAVCQEEGAAVQTILAADVVVPDIQAGLGLLLHPLRLVASLRS
jgi:P-type E1-E2 ATPase